MNGISWRGSLSSDKANTAAALIGLNDSADERGFAETLLQAPYAASAGLATPCDIMTSSAPEKRLSFCRGSATIDGHDAST